MIHNRRTCWLPPWGKGFRKPRQDIFLTDADSDAQPERVDRDSTRPPEAVDLLQSA